ncbi:methyltransferase domain-containing protein [Microtetraspora malaysiensis]|uniref:methyltransferase domain-containing protein n=1 Tax=Microtetraspora malaysiensis TaxID=161358 RepID=UPI000A07903A
MSDTADHTTGYLLGHSELEHRRLLVQASYVRPWTTRLLRRAGLTEGMSVLDIGSGLGDVAFIAAEIVGPGGRVIGVERDPAAGRGTPARHVRRLHRHRDLHERRSGGVRSGGVR